MVRKARARAGRFGVSFNLTVDYVRSILPTHCPILGVPLRFHVGEGSGPREDSPSLDCVVRERGYVPGNVVVVSSRANRIKSDASLEELRALTSFYSRYERPLGPEADHGEG